MKQIAFIALIGLAVSCGKGPVGLTQSKVTLGAIRGGEAVAAGDFSSVVGLAKNGKLTCTGSLISPWKVLTAGHCLYKDQFSSLEELRTEFRKIIEIREEITPSYVKPFFSMLPVSVQRSYFEDAIEELVSRRAKQIKIYVGNGNIGGEVTPQRSVGAFKVNPDYLKYIKHSVLQHTGFKNSSDTLGARYNPVKDRAVLTMTRPITSVHPVKVATPAEYSQLAQASKRVQLVGFGRKIDVRAVEASLLAFDLAKQAFDAETDEERKRELQIDLIIRALVVDSNVGTFRNSGDKQQVEIMIDQVRGKKITAIPLTPDRERGACHGDSGGPAFAKLPNGQLRQIGVIVATLWCGTNTIISGSRTNSLVE